jgi:3-methyl-2-oxobutanoate hydroxymethyltransferase
MNILDFQRKKELNEKITMVTCYDYSSAKLLADSEVECLLVGDSLAMTMHGFQDTLSATMEMMVLHTAAVKRGVGDQFIVADLPFLSYRKSLAHSVEAAQQLMQAGAHAVKLEGAAGNLETIRHFIESGIPVMGHLGLTPQYVHAMGGYRVQGRSDEAAEKLMQDAKALEAAGCFAVVLECIPSALAKKITEALAIPTIGIGAGTATDGQVLVYQDLLGMNKNFKPKFVKVFLDGCHAIKEAINQYCRDVKKVEFPANEHTYDH